MWMLLVKFTTFHSSYVHLDLYILTLTGFVAKLLAINWMCVFYPIHTIHVDVLKFI